MNLRNFQTQLNHAAVQTQELSGDRDPKVIVLIKGKDHDISGFTTSELDGAIVIHLRMP